MSANSSVDVAIVGAGIAGLTAARELGNAGLTVTIVEARDRIGGRTWTDSRFGTELEMGGALIHWMQPHVWAEVTVINWRLPRAFRSRMPTGGLETTTGRAASKSSSL